jgi:hypothetical protein
MPACNTSQNVIESYLHRDFKSPAICHLSLCSDTELPAKDTDISYKSTTSSNDLRAHITDTPTNKDASKLAADEAAVTSGAPAVQLTGKHFFPVVQMLRFYWLPVLLQWTWEFWFAAAFYCYTSYLPG